MSQIQNPNRNPSQQAGQQPKPGQQQQGGQQHPGQQQQQQPNRPGQGGGQPGQQNR